MSSAESKNYYEILGFTRNPFETNTAEREPEIELYAVRPPYLDRVEESSKNTGSFTLSGNRGSGKSATRITVQRNILNLTAPHPLPIALTNFSEMRGKLEVPTALELYAKNIFFLTIEACLIYLTSLDESASKSFLKNLNKHQVHFMNLAINEYYLSRSELARNASAQECFDLFSVSLASRSQMWASKKWSALTSSVIDLTAAAAKLFDKDIGDTSSYKELLSSSPDTASGPDPQFILRKAVDFARMMGFSSILVQVDKIDETDWTTNDADAAAQLIWPIYSNIQIHEIDGLSWSFFVWNKVRDLLVSEHGKPVRWDRLPNEKIKWDEKQLRALIEKRLGYFSNGSIKKLTELFGSDVDDDDMLYSLLVSLSGLTPRILITLLDTILTAHIHSADSDAPKLTLKSVEIGMDTYAVNSILNDFSTDTISQLKKLNATEFVTKDVTRAFSISQPAARQKIITWDNMGLVRRDGQISTGAKPVDKFKILDPRAERIVSRSLDLY